MLPHSLVVKCQLSIKITTASIFSIRFLFSQGFYIVENAGSEHFNLLTRQTYSFGDLCWSSSLICLSELAYEKSIWKMSLGNHVW